MKKAEMKKEFLPSLIIVMSVLLITLLFIYKWEGASDDALRAQTCRSSVYANAALHFGHTELSKNINEVTCPASEYKFEEANEEVKYEIAESMKECWDNFGRGKLELFTGDGVFCSICSYYEFDENVENLWFYLNSKKVNEFMTYGQYLSTDGNAESNYFNPNQVSNELITDPDIDSDKDYVAVLIYARGEDFIGKAMSGLIGGAPGGGVMAIGFGIIKLGLVVGSTGLGIVPGAIIGAVGTTVLGSGFIATILGGTFKLNYDHMENVDWMSTMVFREYNAEDLSSLGCTYAPSKNLK